MLTLVIEVLLSLTLLTLTSAMLLVVGVFPSLISQTPKQPKDLLATVNVSFRPFHITEVANEAAGLVLHSAQSRGIHMLVAAVGIFWREGSAASGVSSVRSSGKHPRTFRTFVLNGIHVQLRM